MRGTLGGVAQSKASMLSRKVSADRGGLGSWEEACSEFWGNKQARGAGGVESCVEGGGWRGGEFRAVEMTKRLQQQGARATMVARSA